MSMTLLFLLAVQSDNRLELKGVLVTLILVVEFNDTVCARDSIYITEVVVSFTDFDH